MKYDESKESLELLRKMKERYETTDGNGFCVNVICNGCIFDGKECNKTNRKERYQKVLERINFLEGKMQRTEFKVGDKVTMLVHGVVKYGSNSAYPIVVDQGKCGTRKFTSEGKFLENDDLQALFHSHIPVPESAYYTTEPEIEELSIEELEHKLSMAPGTLRIKGE